MLLDASEVPAESDHPLSTPAPTTQKQIQMILRLRVVIPLRPGMLPPFCNVRCIDRPVISPLAQEILG